MRPRSPQSRRPRYIKYPPTRRNGMGARQPQKNWTGEFVRWRPGDGGRESENCSLSMASSSVSELQPAASRRKKASGAAQRGRTADSQSKTESLARWVLNFKILAVFAGRNAKNSVSCMGQAHTFDTLTVLVFTRDEARARRLASTKVHFHSLLGEI